MVYGPPLGHLAESDQSVFLELPTPGEDGRTRYSGHVADLGIRYTVGGQQQYLGALHHAMLCRL